MLHGPSSTWFYWVLLGFTGFYLVLLSFTRFNRALPSSTVFFYWVLQGFTVFNRVLPSFTGFYWVLPGFAGFYQVLPCFIFNWTLTLSRWSCFRFRAFRFAENFFAFSITPTDRAYFHRILWGKNVWSIQSFLDVTRFYLVASTFFFHLSFTDLFF